MSPLKKLTVLFAVSVSLSSAWAAPAPQSAEAIYQKACRICHDTGVANAPLINDTTAWESRLALGMDTLVATVKNGKGAMPAKGMCNDCTDDDYKAVILYMAGKKQ